MKILAIETSCDETAISIIEAQKNKKIKILSNLVASQIKIHKPFGGVVPTLARRAHQKNLIPLFIQALRQAKLLKTKNSKFSSKSGISWVKTNKIQNRNSKIKILKNILNREKILFKKILPFIKNYKKPDIDLIAVTVGPGLEPALWTGVNFARALSYYFKIPIIEINHIKGHLTSNFIENKSVGNSKSQILPPKETSQRETNYKNFKKIFPAICLVVSGGHTMLVLMKDFLKYKILGETLDDAAGEAFDKVAKMLELGYPGGPIISAKAEIIGPKPKTKKQKSKINIIFPRPMVNSKDFNFSFSGLKTAVLYKIQDLKKQKQNIKKLTPLICKEFQQAVIDVLISKTLKAAKIYNAKSIMISGGVAANKELRKQSKEQIRKNLPNTLYFIPNTEYCTDNALMIAYAAYFKHQKLGKKALKNWKDIKAEANLILESC